jgi:alcohol dehydrogenase class IV
MGGRPCDSIGGRVAASTGPDGTASTGGGSAMGAAVALRIGAPPRRVEEQAPSAKVEQSTAPASQREFFISSSHA